MKILFFFLLALTAQALDVASLHPLITDAKFTPAARTTPSAGSIPIGGIISRT